MQPYLTTNGVKIYQVILKHIDKNHWSQDIDDYELSMLANAFDMYEKCALIVQTSGMTQVANSGFQTARPEVSIMEKVYGIILKHSAKFGLNPGDRKKIFKVLDQKKKKVFGQRDFNTDTSYDKDFREWWVNSGREGQPDMTYLKSYKDYVRLHREEPADLLEMI